MRKHFLVAGALAAFALILTAATALRAADAPLIVCATTPDVGSLVQVIGGQAIKLTVFSKGTENAHFIEAKPRFIKALSEADLLVETGMELEAAWSFVLLKNSRNTAVQPGSPGYLDVARVITPLEVPTGALTRALGDVHPAGNPHFLLDPLCGLKAAALITQKLSELRPAKADYFQANFNDFRQKLCADLVGPTLAAKYDATKLAALYEVGKLDAFLKQQGDEQALGGWLGQMQPYYGAKAVGDHSLWPYFAKRFGLVMVGYLEPKPGLAPTTHHLEELIGTMKADGCKLILASAYYDSRHADFVARNSGAHVARMANMVGARPGTDDYLSMTDYNIRQIVTALGESK